MKKSVKNGNVSFDSDYRDGCWICGKDLLAMAMDEGETTIHFSSYEGVDFRIYGPDKSVEAFSNCQGEFAFCCKEHFDKFLQAMFAELGG